MCQQNRFQFGRRNLEALILDQFLHAVDNEKVAVFVSITNVAGVQPSVRVDRARRCLRVIEIAFHDLRPAHPDLAFLIGTKLTARPRID